MDALLKTVGVTTTAGAGASNGGAVSSNTGVQRTSTTERSRVVSPASDDSRPVSRKTAKASTLRRGISTHPNLQSEIARAQQAIDYLKRIASQLEALKSDLSSRLSSRGAASRELENHTRQLATALDERRQQAGDGVDAQLDFDADGAQQRFRIDGLNVASLKAGAAQTLGFSVGNVGGPQLATTIEPGLTAEEMARRLDRTLAPVNVRASLDQDRELVFTTRESRFAQVKDAIAVTGRGRVDTAALPASLQPNNWKLGNPDALRDSLREVVQALARVRRSQDAASLALSAAMARTAQLATPTAELAMISEDFQASASSHDYQSLLAITSALVGVSRERVHALLSLR